MPRKRRQQKSLAPIPRGLAEISLCERAYWSCYGPTIGDGQWPDWATWLDFYGSIRETMSEAPNWNQRTTLIDVQFDWEATPTQRPVRLTSTSPKDGNPVRVSKGGAEVEGVINRFESRVLHVRLPKPRMQRADMPSRIDGRGRKAVKKR